MDGLKIESGQSSNEKVFRKWAVFPSKDLSPSTLDLTDKLENYFLNLISHQRVSRVKSHGHEQYTNKQTYQCTLIEIEHVLGL